MDEGAQYSRRAQGNPAAVGLSLLVQASCIDSEPNMRHGEQVSLLTRSAPRLLLIALVRRLLSTKATAAARRPASAGAGAGAEGHVASFCTMLCCLAPPATHAAPCGAPRAPPAKSSVLA